MFPSHVIEAVESEQARKQDLREKRRRSYVAARSKADAKRYAMLAALQTDLLDAPLIETGALNELDCKVDPLIAVDDFSLEPDHDASADAQEWSDQAVKELHEGVLHYTLKVLQARGNGAEKRDALMWVFAPERYMATLIISGRPQEVLLPPEITPFSFEMCCRICGYRSEMLTDLLQAVLRKLGLGELFNEITHATTPKHNAGAAKRNGDAEDVLHAGQLRVEEPVREGGSPRPGAGPAQCAVRRPVLRLRRGHTAATAHVLAQPPAGAAAGG